MRSYSVNDLAQPLAHYPHARRVGNLIFVSGVSCRQPDNSHKGVTIREDGTVEKDIKAQAEAVFENIEAILKEADAGLDHLVDVTVFLVDMDDYAAFNEVYNTYFPAGGGPTRTAVGVRELPHPNLLVELKVVGYAPASP